MKKYQGMAMLLNILPLTVIQNFIHVEVTNASGLIHFLGNQIHRQTKDDPVSDQKKLRIQKKAAMKVCSVLALLLFKNDIRKERYMENLPYLLGQLLHVSDELHVLYCIEKRNGEMCIRDSVYPVCADRCAASGAGLPDGDQAGADGQVCAVGGDVPQGAGG